MTITFTLDEIRSIANEVKSISLRVRLLNYIRDVYIKHDKCILELDYIFERKYTAELPDELIETIYRDYRDNNYNDNVMRVVDSYM